MTATRLGALCSNQSMQTSAKLNDNRSYSTQSAPPNALTVQVNVEVKPERLDEFLEVIQNNAAGSRKEPECYRFDILRNEENPNKFTFYEVYKDREA